MSNNRQTFSNRQHMLAKDYEVYHYRDTRMDHVDPHHHDFFECLFFIGGTVTFRIEGRAIELEPGDVLLVDSSRLHQMIVRSQSIPYERIVLWLNRDFVRRLSSDQSSLADCFEQNRGRDVLRVSNENQRLFRTLLDQLIALEKYRGFGRDLLIRTCLTELLVHLNNEMRDTGRQPAIQIRQNRIIEDIIAYIDDHLDEKIQIDDLASRFFLSKFHLSRKFREYTGTTLYRFIQKKKLIWAKTLILQDLPISQISQMCGFGDSSTFFRAFRHEYDMTPRQFYIRSRPAD